VSDRKLAQNSKNIDIILGGHTHTFLEEPVIEKNKSKKNVLINQVGWAGIQLGRIDIDIKKVKLSSENLVIF
jgi:5'-nucleotidase